MIRILVGSDQVITVPPHALPFSGLLTDMADDDAEATLHVRPCDMSLAGVQAAVDFMEQYADGRGERIKVALDVDVINAAFFLRIEPLLERLNRAMRDAVQDKDVSLRTLPLQSLTREKWTTLLRPLPQSQVLRFEAVGWPQLTLGARAAVTAVTCRPDEVDDIGRQFPGVTHLTVGPFSLGGEHEFDLSRVPRSVQHLTLRVCTRFTSLRTLRGRGPKRITIKDWSHMKLDAIQLDNEDEVELVDVYRCHPRTPLMISTLPMWKQCVAMWMQENLEEVPPLEHPHLWRAWALAVCDRNLTVENPVPTDAHLAKMIRSYPPVCDAVAVLETNRLLGYPETVQAVVDVMDVRDSVYHKLLHKLVTMNSANTTLQSAIVRCMPYVESEETVDALQKYLCNKDAVPVLVDLMLQRPVVLWPLAKAVERLVDEDTVVMLVECDFARRVCQTSATLSERQAVLDVVCRMIESRLIHHTDEDVALFCRHILKSPRVCFAMLTDMCIACHTFARSFVEEHEGIELVTHFALTRTNAGIRVLDLLYWAVCWNREYTAKLARLGGLWIIRMALPHGYDEELLEAMLSTGAVSATDHLRLTTSLISDASAATKKEHIHHVWGYLACLLRNHADAQKLLLDSDGVRILCAQLKYLSNNLASQLVSYTVQHHPKLAAVSWTDTCLEQLEETLGSSEFVRSVLKFYKA